MAKQLLHPLKIESLCPDLRKPVPDCGLGDGRSFGTTPHAIVHIYNWYDMKHKRSLTHRRFCGVSGADGEDL